jgi:hypothetical protein
MNAALRAIVFDFFDLSVSVISTYHKLPAEGQCPSSSTIDNAHRLDFIMLDDASGLRPQCGLMSLPNDHFCDHRHVWCCHIIVGDDDSENVGINNLSLFAMSVLKMCDTNCSRNGFFEH